MKILVLNYEFPPVGGGGGRACWHTCRELARMGHDLLVGTTCFRGAPREETREGVRICRIPALRGKIESCNSAELLSYALSSSWWAWRQCSRERPDLVHVYFGIPSGPGALLLKKLRRIPYVVSLRGSDVPRSEVRKFRHIYPLMKPFLRSLWRNAAAVVSVSKGLRDEALRTCSDVHIDVIPNGVDTALFCPREGAPGRNGPLRLLTVGRLQEFKGIQYLLHAIKELRDGGAPGVDLRIVGDGPYRRRLDDMVRDLNIGDVVEFTPWVDFADMPGVYREADLLVQPSLTEGMPNTVLEAMASGLPVIATDVPGSRDLVRNGENGLLVEREDSAALAGAILKIAEDPGAARQMGRRSRENAEGMSWQNVAAEYLKLYESCAGGALQEANHGANI